MKELSPAEKAELQYWNLFSTTIKLVGLVMFVLCLIISCYFMVEWVNLQASTGQIAEVDLFNDFVPIVVPFIFCILGWLLFRAPKYIPAKLRERINRANKHE